ncbi:MAG TPA: ribosome-associated translation inhibitor RaiA, partial [Limnochordales bacterium]
IPVTVKGKNFEVGSALREYARKKAGKLGRYFQSHDAVRLEVAVGQFRGQYDAEVTLQLGGVFIRGAARADEPQAAVDEAVDRAERQFLRFKSKVDARNQQASRAEQAAARPAGSQEEHAPPEGEGRLVRVKRFELKPMPVEEAVDQMEMLGHDFFLFTNAATGQVNLLYRRKDGNYGLIEPAS